MSHILETGLNSATVAKPRLAKKRQSTYFPSSVTDSSGLKKDSSYIVAERPMTDSNQNSQTLTSDLSIEAVSTATVKNSTDRHHERAKRNRQSALASRERKRQYIAELESERDALEGETRNLRLRVSTLESEKSLLFAELGSLRTDLDKLKQLVFAGQAKTSMPAAPLLIEETSDECQAISNGVTPELGPLAHKGTEETLATYEPMVSHSYYSSTAHSPSSNSHLLVPAVEVENMLDQTSGLRNVFRVHLRHRQSSSIPLMTISIGMKKFLRLRQMKTGSAIGKSFSNAQKRHLMSVRRCMMKRQMSGIWRKIINGIWRRKLKRTHW